MKKKPLSKPLRLRYFLFYKPYGVLSQFTKEGDHKTLKGFGPFPNDVYAAGRLDANSEGLLLLTNDRLLNHALTDPKFGHPRTYLVQVEGIPTDLSLQSLRIGVTAQGRKTLPAVVQILNEEPGLSPRSKPIRLRRSIPTSWLQITLREGKNRQVRRMTASVGFPTLRLVRTKIGSLTLEGLKPGMSRELNFEEISAMTKLLKTRGVSRVFSE